MIKNNCKIIGVDISKMSTGWSVVSLIDGKLKLIDYGFIDTKKMNHGESLIAIEKGITEVVSKYSISYAAIEQMFVGKNPGTGMTLANAHGVVLLVMAKNDIPATYYSVMTMKSKTLGGVKTKKEDGTKKSGDEMKKEVSDKIISVFGQSSFTKEYNNDVTDSISAIYTFYLMDGEGIEKKKKVRKKKEKEESKDNL